MGPAHLLGELRWVVLPDPAHGPVSASAVGDGNDRQRLLLDCVRHLARSAARRLGSRTQPLRSASEGPRWRFGLVKEFPTLMGSLSRLDPLPAAAFRISVVLPVYSETD